MTSTTHTQPIPSPNQKTFTEIEGKYYFFPIREQFEAKLKAVGPERVLSHLTEIMLASREGVESLIQKRIDDREIEDASQARKSIAGNGFQGLVAYALIFLQGQGWINPDLVVTLKPKKHKFIEDYASIRVGDDVQKPDVDLMIFDGKKQEKAPVLIFSIKTSLRERAGQTYKWKLLMDIATSTDCSQIKKKYDLEFIPKADFKIGFITTNFYDEITQPQQKGMLNFFDFTYLTKPGEFEEPIQPFSAILSDLRGVFL